MTCSFPVTNMGAEQNSTSFHSGDFPEVLFTVKVVRKFVVNTRHHDDLIQQGLPEYIVVAVYFKEGPLR